MVQHSALARVADDLAALPEDAWRFLLDNTLRQIDRRDPARGWPQAGNLFNESRAYRYLSGMGCGDILFAPASISAKGPDLLARLGEKRVACEVKTLHLAATSSAAGVQRKIAARAADAVAQLQGIEVEMRILYLVILGPGGTATAHREAPDRLVPADILPADILVVCDSGSPC